MLRVGITGGIGSGKSTVSAIFAYLGVPCFNSDQRAKWISNNHQLVKQEIIEEFGEKAYSEIGYNREFIASQVYGYPSKLKTLNAIIHPRVAEDYELFCSENEQCPYTLKEAAILFESGSHKQLHKTILVLADENLRIKRVKERSGLSHEQILKVISNQMSDDEKIKLSDFVIYNNQDQLLIPQVLELHKTLLNLVAKDITD